MPWLPRCWQESVFPTDGLYLTSGERPEGLHLGEAVYPGVPNFGNGRTMCLKDILQDFRPASVPRYGMNVNADMMFGLEGG
jgi:hypothetical protein